jgi:hypothetical protein
VVLKVDERGRVFVAGLDAVDVGVLGGGTTLGSVTCCSVGTREAELRLRLALAEPRLGSELEDEAELGRTA